MDEELPSEPDGSKKGKSSGDYEVGYGKPPYKHRFKFGQSGNPSGRRKRPATLAEDVARVLAMKVTIVQDGRPTKVTTQFAAFLRLRTDALKGNPRALRELLGYAQSIKLTEVPKEYRELFAEDMRLLKELRQQTKKGDLDRDPGAGGEGGDK